MSSPRRESIEAFVCANRYLQGGLSSCRASNHDKQEIQLLELDIKCLKIMSYRQGAIDNGRVKGTYKTTSQNSQKTPSFEISA